MNPRALVSSDETGTTPRSLGLDNENDTAPSRGDGGDLMSIRSSRGAIDPIGDTRRQLSGAPHDLLSMFRLPDNQIVLSATDLTSHLACGHLIEQKRAVALGERAKW